MLLSVTDPVEQPHKLECSQREVIKMLSGQWLGPVLGLRHLWRAIDPEARRKEMTVKVVLKFQDVPGRLG